MTLCGIFMLRSDKASFAIWRSSETEGGDQGQKGSPYYFVSTYVFGVRGAPSRASGYHSPPICPFTQNLGRIGRAGRLGSKKFQNSSAWCAVYLGVQAEEGEVIATSAPSWAYVITITLHTLLCASLIAPLIRNIIII